MIAAVIDIGSNTMRMSVYKIEGQKFTPIFRLKLGDIGHPFLFRGRCTKISLKTIRCNHPYRASIGGKFLAFS